MCRLTDIRFKTRLPLAAWALAGLITLFSLTSALVQGPVSDSASSYIVMKAGSVR